MIELFELFSCQHLKRPVLAHFSFWMANTGRAVFRPASQIAAEQAQIFRELTGLLKTHFFSNYFCQSLGAISTRITPRLLKPGCS